MHRRLWSATRAVLVAALLAVASTAAPVFAARAGQVRHGQPEQTASAPFWVGGVQLYQNAVDPRTNTVYVAAYANSSIYTYDGATGKRKARWVLPGAGPMGLALNVATNTLYAASALDETVVALDATSGKVKKFIQKPLGTDSREVRVDEKTNRFYVTETHETAPGQAMLAEYDGATNTLLREIPTNGSWAAGLALDVKRNLAYVTNFHDDEVAVVDLGTGKVVGKISTGAHSGPTELAFDPATDHLFISLQLFGSVEILDTVTRLPIGAPVSTGAQALGISVDSAKGRAYVTNYGANTLSALDTRTGARLYDVTNVGDDPVFSAVNTATHDVWVSSGGREATSDTVTKIVPGAEYGKVGAQVVFARAHTYENVVDPTTDMVYLADFKNSAVCGYDVVNRKQIWRIQLPHRPAGLAINVKSRTLYTADPQDQTVQVVGLDGGIINGGRLKATLHLPPGSAKEVRVDEDANRVYVSQPGVRSGSIAVFDGASNSLIRRIPTGGRDAAGLALDPADQRAYVANAGSGTVAVIDLRTGKVERRIRTGRGSRPTGVAADPSAHRLYVTLPGFDKVVTIDTETGRPVGRPVTTGDTPISVVADAAYGRVYVTNRGSGTVSVLDATTGVKRFDVGDVGHAPIAASVNTTTHEVWITAEGYPRARDTLTMVSAPSAAAR